MRDTELFQMALALSPPWTVSECRFDAQARQLDIRLDFPRGSTFPCPVCAAPGCHAYDTEEMTWRHLNFFQHEAYLHAFVPRVTCTACGVKKVAVPWARAGSGFTLLFEALVMTMLTSMPVAAVARIAGEHDTRLWRILHAYIDDARAKADFSKVTRVAFDETAARRGHDYVSLFVDLDQHRVLFATEGKDAGTVEAFATDLAAHGGSAEAVTEVCIDMSKAFIAGTAASLPEAEITFDKFHVVKIVNEAVDQVRRDEQKSRQELKKSRYLWLKNPANLSERQQAHLQGLAGTNLKTARAYDPPDLPRPLRPAQGRSRGLPEAMVLLGHPLPPAADDRGRQNHQAALGRRAALVPHEDRQRHPGRHQQPRPGRQSQGQRLPLHTQPQSHHLPHRRKAAVRPTHMKQRGAPSTEPTPCSGKAACSMT